MTEKKDERDVEESVDNLTDVEGHSAVDDEGDQDGFTATMTGGLCM